MEEELVGIPCRGASGYGRGAEERLMVGAYAIDGGESRGAGFTDVGYVRGNFVHADEIEVEAVGLV